VQLKPPCTELSQVALRFKAKKATSKQIIKSIEALYQVLKDVSQQENVLDSNIAEYTFFPLSIVFSGGKDVPFRAVEVGLRCLRILISCGWRSRISPELGKQFIILLVFLAGGGNRGEENGKNANEELVSAALECLESLFDCAVNAGLGSPKSLGQENIPLLGHALSVVLDAISEGPSAMVRAAALRTLDAMIRSIGDDEVLRRFAPGMISLLAKPVRPGSSAGITYKTIQLNLATLERLLNKVFSDHPSDSSPKNAQLRQITDGKEQQHQQVDKWVQASSGQVKLALANIIPLQYHERSEVRKSLFHLSMSILQNCRKSLAQSIPMLAETSIVICAQESSSDEFELLKQAKNIIGHDPDLSELIKSSLHDWIIALPRIMQSSDDSLKRRGIARLSTAFEIVSAQAMTSDVLQNALEFNLRSSVLTALQADSSPTVQSIPDGSLEVTKSLLQSSNAGQNLMKSFRPVIFGASSQKGTLDGLHTLAKQLKVLPMSSTLQRGLLASLRRTSGDEQLANLWLSLQLLKEDTFEVANEIDLYLNIPSDDDSLTASAALMDDAYAFALDLLSEPSFEKESANWRLQALSLEIIALQACQQKQDFRPELVDALYPILERMGSANAALQSHAITCLNLVSHHCAYTSPSELIIANADYLVNAIALKLNTFEVSPQASLVLVMMVKLCGPALVPYLDDLVESIFTILACFHGYPRLVESLFTVLRAIVEESGKTPQKAIIGPSSSCAPRRQPTRPPTTMTALANRLRNLNRSPPSPPPLHPDPPPETNEDQPLPPQTTLLLSIALQTQNHLTSPSTPLLLSLLSLLTHAFPPLTPYPNQLLPLLATIFPLLTAPFHSPLPQICIAASEALTAACAAGGDFLTSRVEDEWDAIKKTCKRWETEMRNEERMMRTGIGTGTARRGIKGRAWESITKLVIMIVDVVGVKAEMEDDVFELLGGVALAGRNDGQGGRESESESESAGATKKIVSSRKEEEEKRAQKEKREEKEKDPHLTSILTCLRALNPDALWLLELKHERDDGRRRRSPGSNDRLIPPDIESGGRIVGGEKEEGNGDGEQEEDEGEEKGKEMRLRRLKELLL
jgi:hypothetical protein